MIIREQIKQDLKKALKKSTGIEIEVQDIILEYPENPEHGDFSSNLALDRFKQFSRVSSQVGEQFTTPNELAEKIVGSIPERDYLQKVAVASPGFINIYLSRNWLLAKTQELIKKGSHYGSGNSLDGRKILLEHTSPNPQTTIMLGHLRNNFLGMAVSNILSFLGADVTKDCVLNDRGVHLCRALWGYLVYARKDGPFDEKDLCNFRKISRSQLEKTIDNVNWRKLLTSWISNSSQWYIPNDLGLKSDHANLVWYVLGSRSYKSFEKVKDSVEQILLAWEEGDDEVRQLWRLLLSWSEAGYAETYQRIGSEHDWVWKESEHYKEGKDLVRRGLEEGVFRESDGAVVTDISEYALPDTVVVKSNGTALYITQDLALTKLKKEKFPSDLYIWVVGAEQKLYFKQLFSVAEQLGIGKKDDFFHLDYALINFKGGQKMSTRRGNIVMADKVLDDLNREAKNLVQSSKSLESDKISDQELDKITEAIAVGAAKYNLLKYSRDKSILFDVEESLSLEGNSGPYLQYTYARCKSVLAKAKEDKSHFKSFDLASYEPELLREEDALVCSFYKFPEIVKRAGNSYSPHLICNYLFNLSQKYNAFYNCCPILKASNKNAINMRLSFTAATSQILENGLNLLGLEPLERM